MPYVVNDNFQFRLGDAAKMKELLQLRILAQKTLEEVLKRNALNSEIRVWPHHFDTGAFSPLEKGSEISIGLGMATPDSVCSEHYFYISGYKGHDTLDVSKFSKLSIGEWKNDGFKGGILPVSSVEVSEAVQFFQEAIQNYKKH